MPIDSATSLASVRVSGHGCRPTTPRGDKNARPRAAAASAVYVANWALGIAGTGGGGTLTHMWSLSVEEQFYLVWPLLMGLLLRRSGWNGNHYFQGRPLLVHAAGRDDRAHHRAIRYYDEADRVGAVAASTGDRGSRTGITGSRGLDAVIAPTLRVVHATPTARDRAVQRRRRCSRWGAIVRPRDAGRRTRPPRCSAQRSTSARRGSTPRASIARPRSSAPRCSAHVARAALPPDFARHRRRRGRHPAHRAVLFLRLARERERCEENARRSHEEAERRATEIAYFESQQHFSEILQVTRREPEAQRLIKRHLEPSIPDSVMSVLHRNNSDNRIVLMTDVPTTRRCSTRRRRRARGVRGDPARARPPARRHALAARMRDLRPLPGASLCTPSLVAERSSARS